MADLYNKEILLNMAGETPQKEGLPNGMSTGNEEADKYLNSLPPEEREAAFKRLTAPLTGKDIAVRMENADYVPNRQEYALWTKYKATQERSIMEDIANGAGMVFDQMGRAVQSASDHPLSFLVKAGPSVLEAFFQGTRGMYGMVMQSQDPNSVFFQFADAINGRDSDDGYNQFLKARNFNKDSVDYALGKKTMLVDKKYIDHEFTQMMSYIADPTLFVPFGKVAGLGLHAVGMGEKAGMIAARVAAIKGRVLGGALKYVAGKPIEFIGGATRGVIDYGLETSGRAFETATGISGKEFAQTARMSGIGTSAASLAGYGVPVVSDVSNAYIAGSAAKGVGEAISSLGTQIQRGPRGILSYAKQALLADEAVLSPHAKGVLRLINGVDPLFSFSADIVDGATTGVVVGGGLGYLSAGEEGLGHGIGAGVALGSVGGLAGRIFANLTGGTTNMRADITAKYAIEGNRQLGRFGTARAYELFRQVGQIVGMKPQMDGIVAALDSYVPDAEYVFRDNKGHEKFLDDNGFDKETGVHKSDPTIDKELSRYEFRNMQGAVVEYASDGRVVVHINTSRLKDGGFRGTTIPHEIFHLIVRKSVMSPHFIENLKHDLLGVRDPNGKLLERGSVEADEAKAFFKEYSYRAYGRGKNALSKDAIDSAIDAAVDEYNRTGQSTFVEDAINSKKPLLEHLTEEFGAVYFENLVKEKPADWLFFGGKYEGVRGVMDRATTRYMDFWEHKVKREYPKFDFRAGKPLGESFTRDGKRIRVSSIDNLMTDFLTMTQNANRNGRVDISLLSDKARSALILNKGLDDLVSGKGKRDIKEREKALRLRGKDMYKVLSALNQAGSAGGLSLDGNGDFVGRINDTQLDALVRTGHMSTAMAHKIRTIQNLVTSGDRKRVVDFGYWGRSMQIETGPNPARVYDEDVPFTQRSALILDLRTKIGKDGRVSFMAKTLDAKVIQARGDNLWADPEVRALWNGSRNMMDADLAKYLENAGADPINRVESSVLLEYGDGLGGKRRDVLHQYAGIAKTAGDVYFNTPISEINADILNSYTNFSVGLMQDIRVRDSGADIPDAGTMANLVSRNFTPEEIPYQDTPSGRIYTHKSGYQFHEDGQGKAKAYDADGMLLGTYDNVKTAMLVGKQKFQKQVQALRQLGEEIRVKTERGVNFSPQEEFVQKRLNEEFNSNEEVRKNFIGILRDKISELKREVSRREDAFANNGGYLRYPDGSNYRDPVDPRHLNGLKDKLNILEEIHTNYKNGEDIITPRTELLWGNLSGLTWGIERGNTIYVKPSLADTIFDKYNIREKFRDEWKQMYPMTFRSALKERIKALVDADKKMNVTKLRNHILQYGSRTGERIWAEAHAIGLLDYLKSLQAPKYTYIRHINPDTGSPFPRGTGKHTKVQTGLSDPIVDLAALNDFIDNAGIKIRIDEGGKEYKNVPDTEKYTVTGDRAGYFEAAIRINPEYAHGTIGHYGKDSLVHFRATIRTDKEGNKYFYVEEVQVQNKDTRVTQTYDIPLLETEIAVREKMLEAVLKAGAGRYVEGTGYTFDAEKAQYFLNTISERPLSDAQDIVNTASKDIEILQYDENTDTVKKLTDPFERNLFIQTFLSSQKFKELRERLAVYQFNQISRLKGLTKDSNINITSSEQKINGIDRNDLIPVSERVLNEIKSKYKYKNFGQFVNDTLKKILNNSEFRRDFFERVHQEYRTKLSRLLTDTKEAEFQNAHQYGAGEYGQEFARALNKLKSQTNADAFVLINSYFHKELLKLAKENGWEIADSAFDDTFDEGRFTGIARTIIQDAYAKKMAELKPDSGDADAKITREYQFIRDLNTFGNYVINGILRPNVSVSHNAFIESILPTTKEISRMLEPFGKKSGLIAPDFSLDSYIKGLESVLENKVSFSSTKKPLRETLIRLMQESDNDLGPIRSYVMGDGEGGFMDSHLKSASWSHMFLGDRTDRFLRKNTAYAHETAADLLLSMPEVKKSLQTILDYNESKAKVAEIFDNAFNDFGSQNSKDALVQSILNDPRVKSYLNVPAGSEKMARYTRVLQMLGWESNPVLLDKQLSAYKAELKQAKEKQKLRPLPLQELPETSRLALLAALRENVKRGIDTLTLTHPDDGPAVSHMNGEKRTKLYGRDIPAIWDGVLRKYGIKGERKLAKDFLEGTEDPSVQGILDSFDTASKETARYVTEVHDAWMRGDLSSGGIASDMITIAKVLGTSIHEYHFDTMDKIDSIRKTDFRKDGLFPDLLRLERDLRRTVSNNTDPVYRSIFKALEAKREEVETYGYLLDAIIAKNPDIEPARLATLTALSRGIHYKITPELKADILSGKIMTNFSPDDPNGGGGRKISRDSDEFKNRFIGKYARENPFVEENLNIVVNTYTANEAFKRGLERGRNLMGGTLKNVLTIDLYDKNNERYRRYSESLQGKTRLSDRTGGGNVGSFMIYLVEKNGKTMAVDPSVKVEKDYRGRGYQHIFYSEAAERVRSMGATDFFQRIENEKGLPLKSQVKTFGFEDSSLLDIPSRKALPATQENFDTLKNPPYRIVDQTGRLIDSGVGSEPWVFAYSRIHGDRSYSPDDVFGARGRMEKDTQEIKAVFNPNGNRRGLEFLFSKAISNRGKEDTISQLSNLVDEYLDKRDNGHDEDDLTEIIDEALDFYLNDRWKKVFENLDSDDKVDLLEKMIDDVRRMEGLAKSLSKVKQEKILSSPDPFYTLISEINLLRQGVENTDNTYSVLGKETELIRIGLEEQSAIEARGELPPVFKSQLYQKDIDPITFRESEPDGALVDILRREKKLVMQTDPDTGGQREVAVGEVNGQRIINELLKLGGGRNKAYAEAKAIGLIDWLQQESGGLQGQKKIPTKDLIKFIDENQLGLVIDPQLVQDADFGDTSMHITGGEKQAEKGYRVYVVRMANAKHTHPVRGHFVNAVVHIRTSLRRTYDGRKVLHIEEIQANNTAQGILSDKEKEVYRKASDGANTYFTELVKEHLTKSGLIKQKSYADMLNKNPMIALRENNKMVRQKGIDAFKKAIRGGYGDRAKELAEIFRDLADTSGGGTPDSVVNALYSLADYNAKRMRYGNNADGSYMPNLVDLFPVLNIPAGLDFLQTSEPKKLELKQNHPTPNGFIEYLRTQNDAFSKEIINLIDHIYDEVKLNHKWTDPNGENAKRFVGILGADAVEAGKNLYHIEAWTQKQSELNTAINKVQSSHPLQDQKEWVKIAFRTILRAAETEGVSRITITPWDLTPIQVGMKEPKAKRFYGKTILDFFNGELARMNSHLTIENKSGEALDKKYSEYRIKTNDAIQVVALDQSVGRSLASSGVDAMQLFQIMHMDDADLMRVLKEKEMQFVGKPDGERKDVSWGASSSPKLFYTNFKPSVRFKDYIHNIYEAMKKNRDEWGDMQPLITAMSRRAKQFEYFEDKVEAQGISDRDKQLDPNTAFNLDPRGQYIKPASPVDTSNSAQLVDQSYGFDMTPEIRKVARGSQPIMRPDEGRIEYTEQITPAAKVLQTVAGYSIMIQNNKFRVYNPNRILVGIYKSEQEAKKKVEALTNARQ